MRPSMARLDGLRSARSPVDDYRRLTAATKAGDILTLYVYKPESDQRALLTVKIE